MQFGNNARRPTTRPAPRVRAFAVSRRRRGLQVPCVRPTGRGPPARNRAHSTAFPRRCPTGPRNFRRIAPIPGAEFAGHARAERPSAASTSSGVSTSAAPSLMSRWQPRASALCMEPGTASTSRPCSPARRAVMSDPERAAASITSTPSESPDISRLRCGKFSASGGMPGGNSETSAPRAAMAAASCSVFGRIDAVESGAADRDRDAARGQCAAMRRGIDADREPAGDREPGAGERRRKLECGLPSGRQLPRGCRRSPAAALRAPQDRRERTTATGIPAPPRAVPDTAHRPV